MMPYHEDTLCKAGPGEGLCGPVSEVYKATLEEEHEDLNAYLVP